MLQTDAAAARGGDKIRVGFFGGSFNPVHNGHIALARHLLGELRLDEVWFVVSPQNPLKPPGSLLGDAARLAMVEAALEGEARLCPCGVELGLPRPSYTWNTLCHLAQVCPRCGFTLLIGGDNWAAFDRWRNHADILARYPIAIYPRRGAAIPAGQLPPGVTVVDTPLIDISSTDVRRRVAAGLPIDGLVPPAVASMISRNGWYRRNS